MKKMVLAMVMALTLSSSAFGGEPSRKGFVYTVYPVRSCLCSVAEFVKDTTAGVAEGAVTVVEGAFGIVTAPFRVKWKKPARRRLFYQPATLHYEAGKIYEVMPPDLVIELE
tara:strand:+ start:5746 stop:6081 length:336 start_codon:yes stop_codon:yes gene_type:complete